MAAGDSPIQSPIRSLDGGHPLDGAIREQNARLAAGAVALRLERRGERLGLRGPLPCRRGSGRITVQRISLGLVADAKGLEQACSSLRRVQQQLQQQRFRWTDWGGARAPSTAASSAAGSLDAGRCKWLLVVGRKGIAG